MKIKTLHLGLIKTNCYLISTEKAAVVIDPGFDRPGTLEFLNENADKQRLILLTHAHFDHIGGAEALREKTGVQIGIGAPDAEGLSDTKLNLSDMFHAKINPFKPDFTYENGDKITVGDIEFKVISTPGHTAGGVSYLTEDKLFSGDTLFENSIGRTDFPGGDLKVLKRSVEKLFALPPETKVFPGHGYSTTIAREKEYNIFVR